MPCPFPGMDPYIEGQLWTGFHHLLIGEIDVALVPQVRPRYGVFVGERVYVSRPPAGPAGSILPDVTVASRKSCAPRDSGGTAVLAPPLILTLPVPEEIREPYLEIRRTGTREVVTVIELLSPTNKRPNSDGLREYLAKRGTVLRSGAHLVEIDLLRSGRRLETVEP